MVTSEAFRRMALALPDVVAAPHFERTAFKARTIFATLAADGLSANLNFTPEEQALKCLVAPELFEAIDNGWGRKGATTLWLERASVDDVEAALAMAYARAAKKHT